MLYVAYVHAGRTLRSPKRPRETAAFALAHHTSAPRKHRSKATDGVTLEELFRAL